MWKLILIHQNLSSVNENLREILLTKNVKIGRARDCDIQIPSILVGRQQCELYPTKDCLYIISHAQTNKTYVNKRIIKNDEPEKLTSGYIIGLGVHAIVNDKCYEYAVIRSTTPIDEPVLKNYEFNETHIEEILRSIPPPIVKSEYDSDKENETLQPSDLGNPSNVADNEAPLVQEEVISEENTEKCDTQNNDVIAASISLDNTLPEKSILVINIEENEVLQTEANEQKDNNDSESSSDEYSDKAIAAENGLSVINEIHPITSKTEDETSENEDIIFIESTSFDIKNENVVTKTIDEKGTTNVYKIDVITLDDSNDSVSQIDYPEVPKANTSIPFLSPDSNYLNFSDNLIVAKTLVDETCNNENDYNDDETCTNENDHNEAALSNKEDLTDTNGSNSYFNNIQNNCCTESCTPIALAYSLPILETVSVENLQYAENEDSLDSNTSSRKRKHSETSVTNKRVRIDEEADSHNDNSSNISTFSPQKIEHNEAVQKLLVDENSSTSMSEISRLPVQNYIESSSESDSYIMVPSPNKKFALTNIFASLAKATNAKKAHKESRLASSLKIRSKLTEIENRYLIGKSESSSEHLQDNVDSDSNTSNDNSSVTSDKSERQSRNQDQKFISDEEYNTPESHIFLNGLLLNEDDGELLKKHPLRLFDIVLIPLSEGVTKQWTCKQPLENKGTNLNLLVSRKETDVESKIKTSRIRTKRFKRIQILDSSDESRDDFDEVFCNDTIIETCNKENEIFSNNTEIEDLPINEVRLINENDLPINNNTNMCTNEKKKYPNSSDEDSSEHFCNNNLVPNPTVDDIVTDCTNAQVIQEISITEKLLEIVVDNSNSNSTDKIISDPKFSVSNFCGPIIEQSNDGILNTNITRPLEEMQMEVERSSEKEYESIEKHRTEKLSHNEKETSPKNVNELQNLVSSNSKETRSSNKSTSSTTYPCRQSTSNDVTDEISRSSNSRSSFSEERSENPSLRSFDSLIVTVDSHDQRDTKPIFIFSKYHLFPYKSNLRDPKIIRPPFATKKRLGFNFRLHIRYFLVDKTPTPLPRDRLKSQHSSISQINAARNILEDFSRFIVSFIHWETEWLSSALQNQNYCPILWKRAYILYKESEYRRQIKVIDTEKRNDNTCTIRISAGFDPLEYNELLPPRIRTLHYPTYESYFKEWYRPILLEIWASIMMYYSPIDNSKYISKIISTYDDEGLKRCLMIKFFVSLDFKDKKLYVGDLVKMSLPLLREDKILNQLEEIVLSCFGYVERAILINTSQRKDANNRTTTFYDYEVHILVRHPKLKLNTRLPATISLLKGARETIHSIQGFFELAHSPLRHIILSPTQENLAQPRCSPLLGLSESTLHNELRKFFPLNTEQYDTLLKLTKTLYTDIPSLNVIEGAPGTGKTRLLVWLTLTLLAEYIVISKSRSKRILICTPTNESLNNITYLIDSALNNLRSLGGNLCRIVTISSVEQSMTGSSRAYYLHSLANKTSSDNIPEPDDEVAKEHTMLKQDEYSLFAKWESLRQSRFSCKLEAMTFEKRYLERQIQYTGEQVSLIAKCNSITAKCKYLSSAAKHKVKYSLKCEAILTNAHIIVSTIEGLTNRHFINVFGDRTGLKIPICLIDDAHNISEVQSLLPLACGANKLVLAGDLSLPPPTMKSKFAEEIGLHHSLLLRINKALISDIAKKGQSTSDLPITDNNILTSKNLHDLTYHKLHDQHRMTERLTKFANWKLGLDTYYPIDRQDKFATSLRPYIVFDHSFPTDIVISDPQARQEAWLDAEAERAVCIVHSIKQQLRESVSLIGNFKSLILVPDEHHLSRVNAQLINFPSSSSNVSSAWVHCIDSILGLEAHVVVLCLGTVTSTTLDRKILTLAMSRAKMSFIILGHMDYVKTKKIPMWIDMLTFAEKYAACLPIEMNTSNKEMTNHMFGYEPVNNDSPSSSPSTASTCSFKEDDMEIYSPSAPIVPIFYCNKH